MPDENVLKMIQEADMVLAGLGVDFDSGGHLKQCKEYMMGKELLEGAGYQWLLPAWMEYCSHRLGNTATERALEKLKEILGGKNYFLISSSTNNAIERIFRERLVMPCGNGLKKQCLSGGCGEPVALTAGEEAHLTQCLEGLYSGKIERPDLGECEECQSPMILNNIYASNYDERGYLDKWKLYTRWLQGSLNRRLLILEMGVSLRFPTVIRWPFEKTAFYNRKAFLYRVNEKLYQLPEELSSQGMGISQNAIDWINHL